jgi:hypothetical protein
MGSYPVDGGIKFISTSMKLFLLILLIKLEIGRFLKLSLKWEYKNALVYS